MQIDVRRWTRLLDQIAALSAGNRGFNSVISELQERRNRLAREFEAFEASYRRAPPPRSRHAVALEDTEAQREAQLQPLREELRQADDELRRLDAQQGAVFARLSSLRRLEGRIRTWAQQAGVTLPGEAPAPAGAVLPPQPHQARQFAGGKTL